MKPKREDFEAAEERTVTVAFEQRADSETGDGLTLTGYAAVFDSPTEIDSWEGTFTEIISRGAFKKTLAERTPVLQFDHGHHPFVGSIPIGMFTVTREDAKGMYVEARLFDNELVRPVRQAIAAGAINGMSFRFQVVKETWDFDAEPHTLRPLTELNVPEAGPVVFPAYDKTLVSVRSNYDFDEMFANEEARSAFADWLAFGTPLGADPEVTPIEAALTKLNPVRLAETRERINNLIEG